MKTVGVGRRTILSWLVGWAAAATAEAVTLTRAPYLQLLGTHSVTIVWHTDAPARCSVAIAPIGGTATAIPGPFGTVCTVPVANLVPGAQYGYIPMADGRPLAPEAIFQADHPDLPFAFIAIGDTGDGSSAQRRVRDRMLATPRDLIVHTGDMIYPAAETAEWDPKYFEPYAELLRELVFWPCLGNHEVEEDGGASYREAFVTPANNPELSEDYYSFDWGNAHFVVLDSNASLAPGGDQARWLENDLAASGALWKFVVFHHSIYSSSGSSTGLRADLVPVFDRYAVDAVFMGHRHDYERTKPLRGGQVVPVGLGTLYVTTGGGGRSSLAASGTSGWTAYSESAHHFTRVAIDGPSFRLDMIRADGAVRDTIAFAKGVPGPTATTTTLPPPPTSTTTTTAVSVGSPLRFGVEADAYVDAERPTTNFGSATVLTADASPQRVALLRFAVGGLAGRSVIRAVVRVQVENGSSGGSDGGGRIRRVSDASWPEDAVTWATRPALDGAVLATQGAVALGQAVEFDVTAAVAGDGVHAFAIDGTSSNGVRYRAREASAGRPELLVTVGGGGGTAVPTTAASTTGAPSTTTTLPTTALTVPVQADAYVDADATTANFGAAGLVAADGSPDRIGYFRFAVTGTGGRPVTRAVLRLQVEPGSSGGSNSGGRVRRISSTTWQELGVTWATRPPLDGTVLASRGAVALGQVVDFDVTAALGGDGTYAFALDSTSSNGVRYRSRESSAGRPLLILTLGP